MFLYLPHTPVPIPKICHARISLSATIVNVFGLSFAILICFSVDHSEFANIRQQSYRNDMYINHFSMNFNSCPFDFVKVYDGPNNSSALIGTYCGQQRNLVLYSSESSLFVHFATLQRTANTQNRGFKGIYEFSESFVKLDFIHENDGMHIRGSECDQKILSKKESVGFVYSPNYPFPFIPKTVCR